MPSWLHRGVEVEAENSIRWVLGWWVGVFGNGVWGIGNGVRGDSGRGVERRARCGSREVIGTERVMMIGWRRG
jgi:hypothetical protein